jgi:hypothetical protein
MTTQYFSSSNQQTLVGMLTSVSGNRLVLTYQNTLGPLPGRAAQNFTAPDGSSQTIPAAGNPALYYISIDGVDPITPPYGVNVETTDGIAVLGVWA